MSNSSDCDGLTACCGPCAAYRGRRLRLYRLVPWLLICGSVSPAWLHAAGPAAFPQLQRVAQERSASSSTAKTALMQAARAGDVQTVAKLLAGGASIDETNGNGGTALMYAVLGDHVDVVDLLLRNGASVNVRGVNGWGALMIASAKGYGAVVDRLLAADADVNLTDMYGWTPLMRAVYEGRRAVVVRLLDAHDVNLDAVNDRGSTALHLAAIVGDAETARLLLEHGARVSIKDDGGRTAADIAEARGDRALVRLLRGKPSAANARLQIWAMS